MSLQHSYFIRFFEEKQELFSIFQIFSFAEALFGDWACFCEEAIL